MNASKQSPNVVATALLLLVCVSLSTSSCAAGSKDEASTAIEPEGTIDKEVISANCGGVTLRAVGPFVRRDAATLRLTLEVEHE